MSTIMESFLTIPTLSKFQVKVLRKLANSDCKVYCCPAGTLYDRDGDGITKDFNDILRLAELGLVIDVSSAPKYSQVILEHKDDGRDVVIVNLSKRGQRMWERKTWEKWVN